MYIYDRRLKRRQLKFIKKLPGLSLIGVFAISGTAFAATHLPAVRQILPKSVGGNRTAQSQNRNRNGTVRNTPQRFSSSRSGNQGSTAQDSDVLGAFSSNSCAMNTTQTANLQNSIVPQIKKLAEYEAVCGGRITDTSMLFAAMPSDVNNAKELATDLAIGLKEFAKYDLRPVVIWEPSTNKGLVSFSGFKNGTYDAAVEAYFQTLKSQGITDQTMGIWVPFPEPNIPEWDTTDPALVTANVIKAAQMQKKHFPGSKVSVMFDSLSYPAGNRSWDGGAYVSLNPYLKDIPSGLIDSFGYQGFPWAPPASENGTANLSASKFLQAGLAIEAAKTLGVTEIWLNTGTFSRMHTTPGQETSVDLATRRQILSGILGEAKKMQAAGMHVSVHIFAEDKSNVAEGTDWSYWRQGQALTSNATEAFTSFVAGLRTNQLDVWIFDTAK